MMARKFHKLFALQVSHSYFEDGLCNWLAFVPAEDTRRLIARLRLKMVSDGSRMELYAGAESAASLLAYSARVFGQQCFEFRIRSLRSNFCLVTDLPMDWMGQMNYSSREAESRDQESIGLKQILSEEPRDNLDLGTITIFFDTLLDTEKPPLFEIRLAARATQWRYYVINRSPLNLDNPVIRSKDNLVFDGPEPVTMQTGERALLFSSGNTFLPLAQRPKYKMDLISSRKPRQTEDKRQQEKVIVSGLPAPDVSGLGTICIGEEKQVISPVYVYL